MNTLKEYDVLRLIEHNQICYVSSDNIKGCILANWMKDHPYISKKRMFRWLYQISDQLMRIHKCRGNPNYQYVNPYSIVVSEEGNISFLDLGAASNHDVLKVAERKQVREHFLPGKNADWTALELDLYGLGKIIQYLLNFVEVVPGFNKIEERKIRRIISKCIHSDRKKRFHDISDVRRNIFQLQQT